MPEEEKKTVDIDTSGPDAEVSIEEVKDEAVIETEKETGTDKSFENERETKLEEKKDDSELEDYSKGVQSRIAKLTRKMREAERREQAAKEYARSVEEKRKQDYSRFQKTDLDYLEKFEKNVGAGLEAAERELATAIETQDAKAQIAANKRKSVYNFPERFIADSNDKKFYDETTSLINNKTFILANEKIQFYKLNLLLMVLIL